MQDWGGKGQLVKGGAGVESRKDRKGMSSYGITPKWLV
jgi:hypothetical protein